MCLKLFVYVSIMGLVLTIALAYIYARKVVNAPKLSIFVLFTFSVLVFKEKLFNLNQYL